MNKTVAFLIPKEIFYKKTFKSRGFFMGFKLGEGRFNAFKFAPPTYESRGFSQSVKCVNFDRVIFFTVEEI